MCASLVQSVSFESSHEKQGIETCVGYTKEAKLSEVIFSDRNSLRGRESSGAGNGGANTAPSFSNTVPSQHRLLALPFTADLGLQVCDFPNFWPQGKQGQVHSTHFPDCKLQ